MNAYIKEGTGVFRMHPSRSTMQTVAAWSWDAAEKELVEQHSELYRILAAASGKVRKQREAGALSKLDGVSYGRHIARMDSVNLSAQPDCALCESRAHVTRSIPFSDAVFV